MIYSCIAVLVLLAVWGGVQGKSGENIDKIIADLSESIAKSQIINEDDTGILVKVKGLYPNELHWNFAGKMLSNMANSPFFTMYITEILLEASQFNDGPVPTDEQLYLALEGMGYFYDKNRQPGSGIVNYWPQKYNSTINRWYCYPGFCMKTLDKIKKILKVVKEKFHHVCSDNLWEHIQNGYIIVKKTSKIPPDFDSLAANIGVGSWLSRYHANQIPFRMWKENNSDFTQIFKDMKKYAYRPFSTDERATIDPRTYFVLREYLNSIAEEHYPVAYVPTWDLSIGEQTKTFSYKRLPYNVNNIEIAIGANILYGITSAIVTQLADPHEWFDDDLQMIYENTTNLIVWMIERNYSSRPDIVRFYYPSIYTFYWFTSRVLNLLQTYSSEHSSLLYPVMTRTLKSLSTVFHGNVTADLLERATADGDGLFYFEDSLVNNDKNVFGKGKTVKHSEDRLYSTALAINALLSTWMEGDNFVPSVPSSVKSVVSKASQWLAKNIGKEKATGVFFLSGLATKPEFFPVHVKKYINGSAVPPGVKKPGVDMIFGVNSIIPQEEYEAELNSGRYTKLDFHGYNTTSLKYLSSDSFTHALCLLALTKYRSLVTSGQLS